MIVQTNTLAEPAGSRWTETESSSGVSYICEHNGNLFRAAHINHVKIEVSRSDDGSISWNTLYVSNNHIVTGIKFMGIMHSGRIVIIFNARTGSMNPYTWCMYSDDDGLSWQGTYFPIDTSVTAIYHVPNTDTILVGTYSNGIRYTSDGGATWHETDRYTGRWICFCTDPITGYTIAGGMQEDNLGYHSLIISKNNGITWINYKDELNRSDVIQNLYADLSGKVYAFYEYSAYGVNSLVVSLASLAQPSTWHAESNTLIGLLAITKTGRLIRRLDSAVAYSDDAGNTWTDVLNVNVNTNLFTPRLLIMPTERLILYNTYITNVGLKAWYSDPVYLSKYTSRPITKKEAQALIEECKAYVRLKKQS